MNTETIRPLSGRRPFAVISATQEKLGPHTSEENQAAAAEFRRLLNHTCFDYEEVTGFYEGIDQGPSFIIWDLREGAALFIAGLLKQESVLTNRGLLFVDGRFFPMLGILHGTDASTCGNYTRHLDGTCWSFVLREDPLDISALLSITAG